MRLTFEQIKAIAFGAVSVRVTDRGIEFDRCTEKQIKAWYAESDTLGERALATTGIKLDFTTDSSFFEFSAPRGGKFEIHVDGLFRKQFLMNEYRERSEDVRFEILDPLGESYPCGKHHRVTLVFPCHDRGILGHVSVEDGASVQPYNYDTKILFIGDSITQGWDSGYDSLSFAPRVADHFSAEMMNQGIGGSFFNASAFDTLDYAPDITVVAYGTNDWGKRSSAESLYDHARAHLSLIKDSFGSNEKKLFVISPIWRGDTDPKRMGSFSECRKAIIRAIDHLELTHIDGLTLVSPVSDFYADGYLHPNAVGFGIYAENLIKTMRKYL